MYNYFDFILNDYKSFPSVQLKEMRLPSPAIGATCYTIYSISWQLTATTFNDNMIIR